MEIGLKGRAEVLSVYENSAAAMGSGTLEVFATPSMVALMEQAALDSVQPYLEPDQATVGIRMDVSHVAATPMGMMVVAETELIAVEKRRLTFKVKASAGGELIGEGIHERSIISVERFMEKVQAKLK